MINMDVLLHENWQLEDNSSCQCEAVNILRHSPQQASVKDLVKQEEHRIFAII